VARLFEAILDLFFMLGVVWTVSRTIRGLIGGSPRNVNSRARGAQKRAANVAQGRTVRDPVCGMFVSTEVSHRLVQGKEVLHFCSQDCLEAYERKSAKV
jgi:YHS domain-containing protein